jgi:hypothetical protein
VDAGGATVPHVTVSFIMMDPAPKLWRPSRKPSGESCGDSRWSNKQILVAKLYISLESPQYSPDGLLDGLQSLRVGPILCQSLLYIWYDPRAGLRGSYCVSMPFWHDLTSHLSIHSSTMRAGSTTIGNTLGVRWDWPASAHVFLSPLIWRPPLAL